MNIVAATKAYETWLGTKTPLLVRHLALKHGAMSSGAFPFLRATYYRWAQILPEACPESAHAPKVLAVGDLHVENFGTWRDVDGRLVWGINDFDEAHPLPYTDDLIRLAASVYVAIAEDRMAISAKAASAAMLEGYTTGLKAGGSPFVLADNRTPLREMARDRLNTPERFWNKMHAFPPLKQPVPPAVKQALQNSLPDCNIALCFIDRVAGLGSLGKARFTALGTWAGGQIAREAKALTPSACRWASGVKAKPQIYYEEILRRAVRCPDPLVRIRDGWLLRRLSPDCFRIELGDLPREPDELQLLHAMGWETANVHLGSKKAAVILTHLKRNRGGWLHEAAKAMREETFRDWKAWKKAR